MKNIITVLSFICIFLANAYCSQPQITTVPRDDQSEVKTEKQQAINKIKTILSMVKDLTREINQSLKQHELDDGTINDFQSALKCGYEVEQDLTNLKTHLNTEDLSEITTIADTIWVEIYQASRRINSHQQKDLRDLLHIEDENEEKRISDAPAQQEKREELCVVCGVEKKLENNIVCQADDNKNRTAKYDYVQQTFDNLEKILKDLEKQDSPIESEQEISLVRQEARRQGASMDPDRLFNSSATITSSQPAITILTLLQSMNEFLAQSTPQNAHQSTTSMTTSLNTTSIATSSS